MWNTLEFFRVQEWHFNFLFVDRIHEWWFPPCMYSWVAQVPPCSPHHMHVGLTFTVHHSTSSWVWGRQTENWIGCPSLWMTPVWSHTGINHKLSTLPTVLELFKTYIHWLLELLWIHQNSLSTNSLLLSTKLIKKNYTEHPRKETLNRFFLQFFFRNEPTLQILSMQ